MMPNRDRRRRFRLLRERDRRHSGSFPPRTSPHVRLHPHLPCRPLEVDTAHTSLPLHTKIVHVTHTKTTIIRVSTTILTIAKVEAAGSDALTTAVLVEPAVAAGAHRRTGGRTAVETHALRPVRHGAVHRR